MELVFSFQEIKKDKPSIFLAGPTPRSDNVISWRKEAVEILENLLFEDYVFIPEDDGWIRGNKRNGQEDWEKLGLEAATKIVFWVPRDMDVLPGLTTNVEFGRYSERRPKDIILGYPEGAPHTGYLKWMAKDDRDIPIYHSLEQTLEKAVTATFTYYAENTCELIGVTVDNRCCDCGCQNCPYKNTDE